MRFELTGLSFGIKKVDISNKFNIKLNDRLTTVSFSVMKLSVNHLQNPYKSQCSYYDTNQNPFNSVSHNDCIEKCLETNGFIKY